MQEKPAGSGIKKFIEAYDCMKRANGEPCRMDGAMLLKMIQKTNFEDMLRKMKDYEDCERKFAGIESRILSTHTVKDFFDCLLPEIKKAFDIPYIWITSINHSTFAHVLKNTPAHDIIRKNAGFIDAQAFDAFFKNGPKPIVVGRYSAPYAAFFPENHSFAVRSMAIVPMYVDGKVAGSLNFGHFVSNRFVPGMDTSLIQQLMIKVSLSLSRIAAHERVGHMSQQDSLTGLLNRQTLMSELDNALGRSVGQGKNLSVLFLDLDGFNGLNRIYGHEYGDMAVQYVAEIIASVCHCEDLAARFTADEFALVLPGSDADAAEALFRRIQDHLDESPFDYGGINFRLILHYGIASADEHGMESAGRLLKTAYNRLDDSKPDSHRPATRADKALIYKINAS